jgi:hypothetical protein
LLLCPPEPTPAVFAGSLDTSVVLRMSLSKTHCTFSTGAMQSTAGAMPPSGAGETVRPHHAHPQLEVVYSLQLAVDDTNLGHVQVYLSYYMEVIYGVYVSKKRADLICIG